jgi:hypothetical protein
VPAISITPTASSTAGQEAVFLSYREFVESIHVPPGREATWRDFAGWFGRMRQTFREFDGHQVFEEIRGVLAAGAGGVLAREAYLALGVRQSIFPVDQRERIYDLFEKYRAWLSRGEALRPQSRRPGVAGAGRAALRLRGHRRSAGHHHRATGAGPQDAEAAGPLPALRRFEPDRPSQLLLLEPGQEPVLERPEARRAAAAARAHRQLPQRARGDARRQPVAEDQAPALRLDRPREQLPRPGGRRRTRAGRADARQGEHEARTRPEDSPVHAVRRAGHARRGQGRSEKHFATPLLFSIHEAKGLEYENIVLYRFISDHRAEFSEIVDGVSHADLAIDTLDYRRARDKSDKSLEVYKFFVNALYVALTRAIRNVYVIESDTGHPLFGLLG